MERDRIGRFLKGHKGYRRFKKNPKYHRHDGFVWHLKTIRHNGSHRTTDYKKRIASTVSKLWKDPNYIEKHSGQNNPNWKGGAMNDYNTLSWRMRAKLRVWAETVRKRDGRCVFCASRRKLQADHIKPVVLHPLVALDLNNGRTLCFNCHIKTDTYGRKPKRFN